MGGSTSKVSPTRVLPRTKPTPSWAGARTPSATDGALPRGVGVGAEGPIPPPHRPPPRASENKDEGIHRDGADPQFLANLSRLGQVKVPSVASTIRPPDMTMSRILHSRNLSEQQAASTTPIRNRLLASGLSSLLDERKSLRTHTEVARLADRYGMDVDVLDRLTRFVNAPSVVTKEPRRDVQGGEEKPEMQATWIEPVLKPR